MSLIAALAAGLVLSGAPAQAFNPADLKPEDRADLQCLAFASVSIGANPNEAARYALAAGASFYYGRLQGRTPGMDWMQTLRAYLLTEPRQELIANQGRCVQEMQAVGHAFSGLGAATPGA